MAITKILNINCATEGNPATHLKNALEYIQNPDKTEECHLVGSANCLPDSAYEQMIDTKKVHGKTGKRQGYHVIISFPPDEIITSEQARFVAEGFMKDVLQGEYEVVYGIHTDKEHTHIHVIWNSVNLVTGQKYNAPKRHWKHCLQPATNKYCEMLGLEIMPAEYAKEPVNMSKEKWEYEQSFKEYILDNALLCLSYAGSLEHFIFLMKKMGYEFKGKDYLSVRVPGMKLYHRLDKLSDVFSEEQLPTILKNGYGKYYRSFRTKDILYVKRANLTPLQKKYYAKMYRLGLIEKKGYKYRSAELAKEIKRMHSLQEQYLFICDNNVENIMDLLRLREEAKQTLDRVSGRQKEIYKERYVRKRRCKTLEEFKQYQCWNIDSSKELRRLKGEKKKAKNALYLTEACMKENLYTAYARVDEKDELDYDVHEDVPVISDSEKEEIAVGFGIEMSTEKPKAMSVEELAEEISATIQRGHVSYYQLSVSEKASLFQFKVEDNYYNLKLHGLVLQKLGIQMYGSECFEDYQSIYQETMKTAEKQEVDYERKREEKKWEKVRCR